MRSLAIATVLCALAASVNGAPHNKHKKCKPKTTAPAAPSMSPSGGNENMHWVPNPSQASESPVVPSPSAPPETPSANNATDPAPTTPTTPTDAPSSPPTDSGVPSTTVDSPPPAPTNATSTEPAYLAPTDPRAVAVLNSINSYRSQYGVPALTWNEDAAGKAWDQVQQCSWAVTFQPNQGKYSDVEATPESPDNLPSAIDALMAQPYYYSTPGLEGNNGHANGYVNILWKASTDVGCAWTNCADKSQFGTGVLLTCE